MSAPRRYVVMLGFAGAGTALSLAELHREKIQKRFPKHFLQQERMLQKLAGRLTALVAEDGNSRLHHIPENCLVPMQDKEVFPSLWRLAEGLDAGLDVELRKIPVAQFAIEICELFDENLYVNGPVAATDIYGLLIATETPEDILSFAEVQEIPAAVIGRLTEKNDRVVRNGEIVRYLTPEG